MFPLIALKFNISQLENYENKKIFFRLYDFKHLVPAVSRFSPIAKNYFFHSLVEVETNFSSRKTCHSMAEPELILVIWPMANSNWHKSRSKSFHHQQNSIKNCTYRYINASWSNKLGTHMHLLPIASTLLPPKNHPWISRAFLQGLAGSQWCRKSSTGLGVPPHLVNATSVSEVVFQFWFK